MKLKLNFQGVLLFLLLVSTLSNHTTEASRPQPAPKQEDRTDVKVDDGFKQLAVQSTEMETESSWNLMGKEECDDDGDEDCLKRRMITEAHLDYIYTQQHKP